MMKALGDDFIGPYVRMKRLEIEDLEKLTKDRFAGNKNEAERHLFSKL